MMVYEEREADSTTGGEARGEESSYEDAQEGLCWEIEECSRGTCSLRNCFGIKLRVGGVQYKLILVDKIEKSKRVMDYLLFFAVLRELKCLDENQGCSICNLEHLTLFNGSSTFAR